MNNEQCTLRQNAIDNVTTNFFWDHATDGLRTSFFFYLTYVKIYDRLKYFNM